MISRNNIWYNLDWITVFLYMILVVMGWLNIYAAVYNEDHQSILDMTQRYGKQLLWILMAAFIAITVLIIDSKFYVAFAYVFYGVVILLLIAVLFFGKEVNGARAWFEIGGFALQPAELGKFATNLAVAKYISQYNFKMHRFKSLAVLGMLIGVPALLIIAQNDTGSALVYAVFILVFYREGLSGMFLFWGFAASVLFILTLIWPEVRLVGFLIFASILAYGIVRQRMKEVAKMIGIFAAILGVVYLMNYTVRLSLSTAMILYIATGISILIFIIYGIRKRIQPVFWVVLFFVSSLALSRSVSFAYEDVLVAHQRDRIDEVLGIRSDPLGVGYNVNQSKIAIGSGGVTGKGFLKGTQTKFNFVPEQSTDFIFCTVGEEWGFLGTSTVIILFMILLIRLLILAERQRSRFSRVYGYGVAGILFFHFAINVGMTIGLVPVIGIPLPFFSYGGSSLWSFTFLLFIFLRLDASRMEILR
ncbi:rod shape-determining protein RodA [Prolixibacter bellariivorans]|uniref:Cell wall polymerase n=1 Tax=Prolixibacter bellariivorans TaxID=314319 RepID=A0A5M4B0U1_9BACT|nr:rod shape-determining protein RodA [Prolixibacter bellariivorans]GET33217.1 rod shape-determining protein RodA [Prolixibacter bellariivorans]